MSADTVEPHKCKHVVCFWIHNQPYPDEAMHELRQMLGLEPTPPLQANCEDCTRMRETHMIKRRGDFQCAKCRKQAKSNRK